MYTLLFPGVYGRFRGGGSKKKSKKQPKANWFEELNATQCKELGKAAKLKVSGSKKELVERLLGHDFTGAFGGNQRGKWYGGGNMTKIPDLKEECRKRLLQVSGTKFDLVLRIVQHEYDTGGATLKRAATEVAIDEHGQEQHVAKKCKPSKASPATMYNRIEKKIESCSQKKYQSYWGSKSHAPAVCSLMWELLKSLEPHVASDPQLVLDGCYAIVSSFVENFSSFDRPGYCDNLESMVDKIISYADQIRSHVTPTNLEKLAKILLDWHEVGDPYGLFMDHDMEASANAVRHGPNYNNKNSVKDNDDNKTDQKPAAATSPADSTKPGKPCTSPDTLATEPSTDE